MKQWNLNGKKALVTGGSKGIGKAVVAEFLALGAEVLFTGRNAEEITAVEEVFRDQGYSVYGIMADASSNDHRHRLKEWITERWGRLDILVNNAGINIRKKAMLTLLTNIGLYWKSTLLRHLKYAGIFIRFYKVVAMRQS